LLVNFDVAWQFAVKAEGMMMKTRLMVSVLASVSGLGLAMGPSLASAQEVGKVISSTPVVKRVTEPKSTCTNDADGRQRCRSEMVTEDRTIGYKVVYEYAGRQREAQLPFPPGQTIELEVTPAVSGAAPSSVSPAAPVYSSGPEVLPPRYTESYSGDYSSSRSTLSDEPVYVERVERVVREPVYIERSYDTYNSYGSYYSEPSYGYAPRYYSNPLYPVVGLALGLTAGYYATRSYGWGGYRGGYGGRSSWSGHGYRGSGRGHR
jgi:hypothetical protein